MMRKQLLRSTCASVAALSLVLQAAPSFAGSRPEVETGPKSSPLVQKFASNVETATQLTYQAKLALLQQKVKYVFVLFQENRSFDQHFGTFPGADGLFSKPASATPGFTQTIVNTDGSVGTISPFLITQSVVNTAGTTVPLYPADTDSVDHSHAGIVNSAHIVGGVAQNDRYALNEEKLTTDASGNIVSLSTGKAPTSNPTLVQKQRAELVMSHLDCDTIPFLWQYADRFTLLDNFHQTIIGPSTPNAIAMIAGQSGDTQWVLHPGEASSNTASTVVQKSGGVPIVGDVAPFPGSELDQSPKQPPYGPNDVSPASPGLNQTYATLPLSFMGRMINTIIANDQNPAMDLLDVQDDIKTIASNNLPQIPWGWYQQGYDLESTDTGGVASHAGYITHHNGPQYFGYIGDNTTEQKHLHGLGDFFSDLSAQKLGPKGVYYVRGGYGNLAGMVPSDPTPGIQAAFNGNDDHPGYSDAQISEALVAQEVNAIAASPYWKDSAIIITYDETDGLYDHAAFSPRSTDPEGNPLDGGPRVPAIVISPYSAAHAIVHGYSEHSSVIKFIDELFGLTALGALPDEAAARRLGEKKFGQANLGPADSIATMGNLFNAFDNDRLTGAVPPLPASYAMIPAADVTALPPYGGEGCYVLNIVPTDYVNGTLIDPPPADFNPRPGSAPGIPTAVDTTVNGTTNGGVWVP